MNDPIKENLNYDFMDSFHDYGFLIHYGVTNIDAGWK